MGKEQALLELALFAEQKIAQGPVAVLQPDAFDIGQYGFVVVDQARAEHGR
ncbi:hypothetical protein D3C75_1146530 [compost metagenome]